MSSYEKFFSNPDAGLLVLRLAFSITFFMHGFHKIGFGVADGFQALAAAGIPGQLMYFAYVSEVLAPVLILLGIFTRISIVTVLATMITIFYVLPFPIGFGEHGELNIEVHIFYTLVPLALFFTGPGRYRVFQNKSGNWLLD